MAPGTVYLVIDRLTLRWWGTGGSRVNPHQDLPQVNMSGISLVSWVGGSELRGNARSRHHNARPDSERMRLYSNSRAQLILLAQGSDFLDGRTLFGRGGRRALSLDGFVLRGGRCLCMGSFDRVDMAGRFTSTCTHDFFIAPHGGSPGPPPCALALAQLRCALVRLRTAIGGIH
jgi:hypothetical protein